ncbi:hypothetical protein FQA39_LY14074 [Lamprigera yunnana]|nr:hypothetical protein FQA39_LY14074 [Lamprigera yunnana]
MANLCNSDHESTNENVSVPSVYPVVLGTPETSISIDSDGGSSVDLSEHIAVKNDVLSPGSTIHVQHSTDVVIGPLTQFHGPVTIHQNIKSERVIYDGDLKTIKNNLTNPNAPENAARKDHSIFEVLSKTSNKQLFIYCIIIFVTLFTTALGITLSLKLLTRTTDDTEISTDASIEPHKIIGISEWGGKDLIDTSHLLNHPVKYVIIAHTAGHFCTTFSDCSNAVQQIQVMHFRKKIDIKYNFLIGGDNNVYEGRGWDVINFHKNNTICIAFIGNYLNYDLPPNMVSLLQELLAIGEKLGKISPDYKIVCHNQTAATLSPGDGVYSKVSKLSHFYSGRVSF